MKIKISNKLVDNILDFNKEIQNGEILELTQKISIEDGIVICNWLKNINGVEKYRVLDSLIICLIDNEELCKSLKEIMDL